MVEVQKKVKKNLHEKCTLSEMFTEWFMWQILNSICKAKTALLSQDMMVEYQIGKYYRYYMNYNLLIVPIKKKKNELMNDKSIFLTTFYIGSII